MKKILEFIKEHFISIIIIMLFTIATSNLICKNDLFFDIKTGEDIIKNGFTFKDHFSFIPNLTYLYLHWLYDVCIYCVYKLFDFGGLFILFTGITSLFCVIYYNELYKIKNNKILSLIVTIVMILLCKYSFVSRVQTIIYLLLFLEVLFLEKLYRTGEKKYTIYLVLLSMLVVNLQMPIWIFYFILTLPYIVENILSKISKFKLKSCTNNKLFYMTIILILIGGLLSPLGYKAYTFFLKSLNNPIYIISKLGEMQPTEVINCKPVLYITLLFIVCMYFKLIKLSLRAFCLMCGLFIFSLIVRKNVIFYIYFGIYIIYKNININFITNIINDGIKRINTNIIEIILILILIPSLAFVINEKRIDFDKYGFNDYPKEIVEYLKSNTDYRNIKIFTNFNTGSYFLFNDIPVFIDSRAEVYIKEYNGGYNILNDYNALSSYNTYRDILNKYNFEYLATERGSALYYYLDLDEDYCITYGYKEYVLFKHFRSINILGDI